MKKRSEKKKKGLIVAIFAVAIFMAAAYAALEATLTINAVGKIYSDWDVEFTDSVCTPHSAYDADGGLEMECFAKASALTLTKDDHIGHYLAGIVDDGDPNKGTDGIGGIELNLYTEFATPEDTTEFNIEITNFSSMWDAVLMSIVHTNERTDDDDIDVDDTGNWILYDFATLKAEGGEINEDAGNATVLSAVNAATPNANKVQFKITASWNPEFADTVPDKSIKKEQEATNFVDGTGSKVETYTQIDKFVLLWQAYAPGDY